MLQLLLAVQANAQGAEFANEGFGLGGGNPFSVGGFEAHIASRTGVISVTCQLSDGWHINSVDQQGGPIATKISLGETDAVTLAGKFEPDVEPHEVDDGAFDVARQEHTGRVTWSAPVRFLENTTIADLSIPVKFFYQACAESCLPPKTEQVTAEYVGELSKAPAVEAAEFAEGEAIATQEKHEGLKQNSSGKGAEAKTTVAHDTPGDLAEMANLYNVNSKINYVPLHVKAETTLVTALFGAFVGGFLLNLMPCVFPVLGIKVMGFVEQAGSDPKKIRLHGIVFAAGLTVSMWALAGFVLFVKLSMGQNVNWGQQMGSPYFVAAIIVLLFLMGLNMAGVFEFGGSMTRIGGWCATCRVNEKRVFSNELVRNRLREMGVVLVAADMTVTEGAEAVKADLARADRVTISTYLVYPANYPESPAILLEELISPDDVLVALDRIRKQKTTFAVPSG